MKNPESLFRKLISNEAKEGPESGKLYGLFRKLNDPEYSRYSRDAIYNSIDGKVLKPLELLEVVQTCPAIERVAVAYFEEGPTRVMYAGENADSMRETVDNLRLPTSWPSNIGEKVFYCFRDTLKGVSGPVALEQEVVSGKVPRLELVLNKLIETYRTQ